MTDKIIVLITGANSGIGYAAAKVIASASPKYHVIMAARVLSKGEAALSELQSTPSLQGTLSLVQLDVTDDASIAAAVQKVDAEWGHLDVLVNNAGMMSMDPSLKTRLQSTINTNVIGAIMVAEAFKPLLAKAPKSYLIHVSSTMGSLSQSVKSDPLGQDRFGAYRVSKAALNMWMLEDWKQAKREGWNMKVFSLSPGLVVSNLRGTDEEQQTCNGLAISADTSGEMILNIIEGNRDGDDGKFVHKAGIYDW